MNKGLIVAMAAGTVLLGGCAALFLPPSSVAANHSSSLVDFLYPDHRMPPPSAEQPRLMIPLRVGLAFLPSTSFQPAVLDDAHKEQLLERIKQHFVDRDFVSEITIVPDYYLQSTGTAGRSGFADLEAVQRLYNLDVIALVSFDQDSHLDNNEWSLAYATIVGAFVIKGSRHDVSTLIDLAVVDPASHQLVIRAGGTDVRHGNTTLVNADRLTREADLQGFSAATDQMISHFDTALTRFEADVKAGKSRVRVESRDGTGRSGGGGALNGTLLVLLLLAVMRRATARA